MSLIGSPLPRVDGPAKVSGEARYAAEFAPKGLLYAATADSTCPAGIIAKLDTVAAERAPGVRLVLTYLNADHLPYEEPAERVAVDPVAGAQLRVLDGPAVLFSGQPIALVVAGTQAQAEYAASLVKATYEADPAAKLRFDPTLAEPASEAAAKKKRGPETRKGDAEGAFARAPVTIEARYGLGREQHHPMEPHATVAEWTGERLTLWSKTQWVGNERDEIARRFGIPAANVHVINPFVGGAFGSSLRTWPHVTLAAMAARRAGRPVRLELTRRQMFTYVGHRGQSEQHVRLGADHDGRLLSTICEAVGQTSTYEEFAEPLLGPAGATYACDDRLTRYKLVRMNVNTPCPMRGPGWATGLVAQEMAMDELAEKLGMDPIALRLRNYAERDPMKDLPWSSKALRECYAQGAERFGWSTRAFKPGVTRDGRDLVGFGMATAIYDSGRYPTSASVTLFADGTARVRCATTDMGPGTYTSMTQVAADALGLPMSRVSAELGDSALPTAKEHGGSTTMASVGPAVQEACAALKAKLAALPNGAPADSGDPAAALRRAGLDRLGAEASSKPDDAMKTHSINGFGAVFAEVRVDADLCTIRATRIVGAYDAGRIVNPRLAHSQCIGGMVQGMGMALFEEVEWDEHLGRVGNGTIAEYIVPVNADVHELDAIFVETREPLLNPLGVKGVAELGLCGVAPAIANAVWHATGKRVRDLPITPRPPDHGLSLSWSPDGPSSADRPRRPDARAEGVGRAQPQADRGRLHRLQDTA